MYKKQEWKKEKKTLLSGIRWLVKNTSLEFTDTESNKN